MAILSNFTIELNGSLYVVRVPNTPGSHGSAGSKLDKWLEGESYLKGQDDAGNFIVLGKSLGPLAVVRYGD